MKPVMYLIANKELGMSPGKLAAQAAHAAVRAYIESVKNDTKGDRLYKTWLDGGETKIVLEARDTEHLRAAKDYIESRGYKTYQIIDEGRTEIAPHSLTVLGVEVVDKDTDNAKFTFSDFRTYREDKPERPKEQEPKTPLFRLFYRTA